jgi:DNA-directed RNA polymerase specialized sigma24 family protein
MAERVGYDEFVAARSARLLRLAYLLTRDWALAEDLLQTALVKAWFAWARLDGEPEAYVRKVIATTYVSWRRRRWTRELSHGDLPERSAPDGTGAVEDRLGVLGVSVGTVKSQASRALEKLRADRGLMDAEPERSIESARRGGHRPRATDVKGA